MQTNVADCDNVTRSEVAASIHTANMAVVFCELYLKPYLNRSCFYWEETGIKIVHRAQTCLILGLKLLDLK